MDKKTIATTAGEQAEPAVAEQVRAAMRRAYSLGQTYWQQADSEYTSQNKKADVTAARFIELTDEICAQLAAPIAAAPAAPEQDDVRNQALEDAAKVCEKTPIATYGLSYNPTDDGYETRDNIAKAIRAMKTATNEGDAA